MAVTYQTEGVKMPDIKKRETTEWIKNVAASYGKRLGEIAYIFCSDEKILEVNRQYLQHDYYTDIITFDYCQGDRLSGDLFISLIRYAPMPNNSGQLMMMNYTGLLFTVFFISAVSMTKVPGKGKLWKRRRIRRWQCDSWRCNKKPLTG